MRYTIIIFCLASLIISSCKKEKNFAPTTILNETVDTTAAMDSTIITASLIFGGDFTSGPFGTVTGRAEVYKKANTYDVKLANFTTNNGPALHVYIAKEAMPITYIDLGALKSTAGNQVYSVPGMPDFTSYKYISIHCVTYNHLFGSALLK
jgi:Electron transfer DM13